jgi:hypothetical protein
MTEQISADLARYGIPEVPGLVATLAGNFARDGWAEVQHSGTRAVGHGKKRKFYNLQIALCWSDRRPAKVLYLYDRVLKGVSLT